MQPVDLALDGRVETRSLEWDQGTGSSSSGLQRERADLAKSLTINTSITRGAIGDGVSEN